MTRIFDNILTALALILFLTSSTACGSSLKNNQLHSATNHISGQIRIKEGNCMPGPNTPPCKAIGKQVTVLLTQLSETYNNKLLIDKIISNEQGEFSANVAIGTYSLFIQYQDEIHCPNTICDPECYCMPVEITANHMDSLRIDLDLATY